MKTSSSENTFSETIYWVAAIPIPSANRLQLAGVYLTAGNNWNGFEKCKLEVEANGAVVFSLPNSYEPQNEMDALDGNMFYLEAEFKNSTGSRTEILSMQAIRQERS